VILLLLHVTPPLIFAVMLATATNSFAVPSLSFETYQYNKLDMSSRSNPTIYSNFFLQKNFSWVTSYFQKKC